MNDQIKKRLLRTLILSLIALVIGVGIGFYQIKDHITNVQNKGSQPIEMAGISVGGPFTLLNDDGVLVTEKAYEDDYKLIYFGFTYCPAICPTELQKISKVMNALPAEISEHIQPLFITVDPERDTVDVMHQYVALFHPKLIGLTGSREQIDDVLKNYRVFARKVQDETMDEYTMDHSSFIYLMSKNDEVLAIYRIQDKAGFITQDIEARL